MHKLLDSPDQEKHMPQAPTTASHDEMLAHILAYFVEHDELLDDDELNENADPDEWGAYVCWPHIAANVVFPTKSLTMTDCIRLMAECDPSLRSQYDVTDDDSDEDSDDPRSTSLLHAFQQVLLEYFTSAFVQKVDSDPELTKLVDDRRTREQNVRRQHGF